MFSTLEVDQIALPVGLREPSQNVWSHVELLLSVPWLFLEISIEEDEQKIKQVHFLLYWKQFTELATNPEISIDRVILATPGHMNHASHWKFEELSEAWICADPSNPAQTARVYVVSSGAVYSDSYTETPPDDLIRKTRIYPVENSQRKSPLHP